MPIAAQRGNAVMAIGFGLALVALALPRFVAGALVAPHGAALAALGRGETPSLPRLSAARQSRRAALGWHETGRRWAELGALALARAQADGLDRRARSAYLDQSITAFRNALVLAPAEPFAWTHYARALLARDGAGAALNPLLRLSVATAPFEPRVIRQRIEIGIIARGALDDEVRRLIDRDIRFVAGHAPRSLAGLARRRHALHMIREVLAGEPDLLRRFDRAYLMPGPG